MSSANLYGIGVGTASTAALGLTPIVTIRDPGPNDINGPAGTFRIGQLWVNTVGLTSWQLVSYTANFGVTLATWSELGNVGGGALNFLTPDLNGLVTPLAGNINILGTAGEIVTTGSAETITLSIPDPFIAPGAIQATSISSTGTTTLATTAVSTNTFGNANGATQVTISSGTGGTQVTTTGDMSIDGAGASNYFFAPSSTTGQIFFGGSAETGTMFIGLSPNQAINIGVEGGTSATSIYAGSGGILLSTMGDLTLNGLFSTNYSIAAAATTGTVTIGGTAQTGDIDLGVSTVTQNINIGTQAAAGATNIRAGSGEINLLSGVVYSNVTTAAATYSVTPLNQLVFVDSTANAVTVTLEAAPITGRTLSVYDVGGNATTNNITVSGNGKQISQAGTLAATKLLTTNFQIMTLTYSVTNWNAAIIA